MEPYYDQDGITIYHGDCREVLPHLPKVEAVITDPPFFMPATHYQSRVNWQRRWGDTSILRVFWSVILDSVKIKESGHCLVFCNHESYPVFYPEMYCRFDYCKSLVWDKGQIGMGRVWRNQHELIIAARWKDSIFNEDGKTRCDVLRHQPIASEDRSHPVEKPTQLLSDLIIPTTSEGQTVLDPFMGGGSTLLAAKLEGRKAIGIEIEERYCEISANRLRQKVLF